MVSGHLRPDRHAYRCHVLKYRNWDKRCSACRQFLKQSVKHLSSDFNASVQSCPENIWQCEFWIQVVHYSKDELHSLWLKRQKIRRIRPSWYFDWSHVRNRVLGLRCGSRERVSRHHYHAWKNEPRKTGCAWGVGQPFIAPRQKQLGTVQKAIFHWLKSCSRKYHGT